MCWLSLSAKEKKIPYEKYLCSTYNIIIIYIKMIWERKYGHFFSKTATFRPQNWYLQYEFFLISLFNKNGTQYLKKLNTKIFSPSHP